MVAEKPGPPAVLGHGAVALPYVIFKLLRRPGVDFDHGRNKGDSHVEFLPLRAHIVCQLLHRGGRDLAHGQHAARGKDLPVHLPYIGVGALAAGKAVREGVAVGARGELGVGEILGLVKVADGVDPKAVHALIHPPVHHAQYLPTKLRAGPVKVRLLFGEIVEIILPALRHKLPGAAPEAGGPIVWLVSVHRVPPDVVIAFGVISGGLGRYKPWMLV